MHLNCTPSDANGVLWRIYLYILSHTLAHIMLKSHILKQIMLHAITYFNTSTVTCNHTLKHIYRHTQSNTLTTIFSQLSGTWIYIPFLAITLHLNADSVTQNHAHYHIYTQSHALTYILLHAITRFNTCTVTRNQAF